jgi:hypothetical protein
MKRTTVILAALACVAILTAGKAHAAEFYVIASNPSKTKAPHAQIDVAVDTQATPGGAPAPILSVIYEPLGSEIASFTLETNDSGFVSTASASAPFGNLFAVSGGIPLLVKVWTPSGASLSAVTLKTDEHTVRVPPARRLDGSGIAQGRIFSVAVGADRTTLLVANVCGTDIAVDVFLGRVGARGDGKYANPRLLNKEVWMVELDESDASSHVIVRSTCDIVLQVVTHEGTKKGPAGVSIVMPIE